jgi:hypothetical protein
MSFLLTATTVVSAFGVVMVSPFNIGLAADSFNGIHDKGSLAMLEAARRLQMTRLTTLQLPILIYRLVRVRESLAPGVQVCGARKATPMSEIVVAATIPVHEERA